MEQWIPLTDDEVSNFWGPGQGLGQYANMRWMKRKEDIVPGKREGSLDLQTKQGASLVATPHGSILCGAEALRRAFGG